MGVYSRFKKTSNGVLTLAELWESSAASTRKRMIEVGQKEDPEYTRLILNELITFQAILTTKDSLLMDILAEVKPQLIAFAINSADKEQIDRFLRLCLPSSRGDLTLFLEKKYSAIEEICGQLSFIKAARLVQKTKGLKVKDFQIKI
jgi:flagellar motor switch protein FliG